MQRTNQLSQLEDYFNIGRALDFSRVLFFVPVNGGIVTQFSLKMEMSVIFKSDLCQVFIFAFGKLVQNVQNKNILSKSQKKLFKSFPHHFWKKM